jgi:hypothetical protein
MVVGVLLVIAYILCFVDDPYLNNKRQTWYKWCMISCKTDSCIEAQKKYKGKNYHVGSVEYIPLCPIGIYEISHMILHIFIGYYFNFWYSFAFGISFEIYEYYAYNCESIYDIICNSAGALIGIGIRSIL